MRDGVRLNRLDQKRGYQREHPHGQARQHEQPAGTPPGRSHRGIQEAHADDALVSRARSRRPAICSTAVCWLRVPMAITAMRLRPPTR
jgi:hypothetical protein